MRTNLIATLATGVLAVGAMGGCAAQNSDTDAAADATPVTITLGAVPGLDLGLIAVTEDQGYFAEENISVEIVPVDSGPNVVTGVVAGQYDVGATAWAPPLLAFAEGADLKLVSGVGTVGPDGTNGGVLVKKDSGISSWADLEGKKVASNAPRSLFSLTVPAAIAAAGGDGTSIEIVPLPFNEIAGAVEDGSVDAGVSLEPFLTGALAENSDLVNIGDSIFAVLPEGSASGLYFTSGQTATEKADAIAGFQTAIAKGITYANDHLDEVKTAGAKLAGLTAEQAAGLPLSGFTSVASAESVQALLDLMVKFAWIESIPDLTSFLG